MTTTRDTISEWWDAALQSETDRIAKQNPGFPVDEWRTAGRKTKAKPSGEDLGWWAEAGLEQALAYAEWLDRSGWSIAALPDGSPAVEFGMSPVFAGREVRMYVDAVYETAGQYVTVDYKSGTARPDSAAQLGLYAEAMRQTFGISSDLGAFYMTRNGALTEPLDLTHYTGAYWDDVFNQFFTALDNRIFLPNISRNCSFCSVAANCAAMGGADAHRHDTLAGATRDVDLPPHASYSQLTSWTRCGKAYELERLRRVPSRPSVFLAAGSAIHTVIERINLAAFAETKGAE